MTRGPRPLAAHLAAGAGDLAQGLALAHGAGDARFPWRRSLRAEGRAWAAAASDLPTAALSAALARRGVDELEAALTGVRRLGAERALRRPKPPPVAARFGAATLYDFGPPADGPARGALLALPSLVNTSAILDLTRSRSLLRGLRARGLRVFLLDWGDPGPEERAFDVADYALQRAAPALEAAAAAHGGRVAVLGHCMAGGAAAAAAAARPAETAGLAMIAAPWDFRPLTPPSGRPSRAETEALLQACGAVFGGVPSDVLNTMFFLRDPLQAMRKFPAFGRRRSRGAKDRLFLAVEAWLADGLRLAAPAARTLFVDWALDNALAQGRWRVGGAPLRLQSVDAPVFVAASPADTVAPRESVVAIRAARPDATLVEPKGGHVGMIVGSRAETDLWDPLAEWAAALG